MKIFLPEYIPSDEYDNEYYNHLFISGLNENGCTIVNTSEESDFIIVESTQLRYYNLTDPNKTIVIDISDLVPVAIPVSCLYYFKRSCVDTNTMTYHNYLPMKIIEFPLYIKKSYTDFIQNNVNGTKKIYDICCTHLDMNYLGPNNRNKNRTNLVKYLIKTKNNKYNYFMNYDIKQVSSGRSGINIDYFNKLKESKIIITNFPDEWTGDYRIFESLASGALVFCDTMVPFKRFPLEHKKHLIFYSNDNLDEMFEMVEYYLQNPEERETIAKAGYLFAMEHHTYHSRIKYVTDILKHTLKMK